MKIKFLPFLLAVLFISLCSFKYFDLYSILSTDDTTTLQNQLSEGPVKLTAGHGVYYVTTLTAYHNLDLNGNTLQSSATSGAIVTVPSKRIKISNGKIIGVSDVAGNIAGVRYGDKCDSDSLVNIKILKVSGSALFGNDNNHATAINCNLSSGYIATAFYTVTKDVYGITLIADTFDRSQLKASTITEAAMIIRGSGDNSFRMKKAVVAFCLFKMPYNPINAANPSNKSAECSEVRYIDSSYFYKCTCNGGTEGFSVVGSKGGVTISTSTFLNQNLAGIEYTAPGNGAIENCSVTDQLKYGILLDYGASNMTITNTSVIHCANYNYNITIASNNTTIIGGQIICPYRGISLSQSSGLHLNGVTMKPETYRGQTGTIGIVLDTSTGDLDVTGGAISGFSARAITYYSSTHIAVNSIHMQMVNTTGTPGGLLNNSPAGTVNFGKDIKVN